MQCNRGEREDEGLGVLCRRGKSQIIQASSAQITELRDGFAPVYQWLRGDASTARYLDQIDALKASVTADPNDVPDCFRMGQASAPGAVSPIDGNYLAKITKSDLQNAGLSPGDIVAENYGEFRIVFDRGRFAFTQHETPACTWAYGTFSVNGDRLQMSFVDGGGESPNDALNKPGELFDYAWSSYKGAMKWSTVPDAISPEMWTSKPWLRQGTAPASRFLSKQCPPPDAAFER